MFTGGVGAIFPSSVYAVPAHSVKRNDNGAYTGGGSSVVIKAYKALQIEIPDHPASSEASGLLQVSAISELQTGDVVFLGEDGDVHETGIYIGEGQYIKYDDSDERKQIQANRFIGGARVFSEQDRQRIKLILDARRYLGTPYVFGSRYGQTDTFDCSSFTKTVFGQSGITLPRVSREQAKLGTYVNKSELKTGDLVFFAERERNDPIAHVGIYAGDGVMIHTYQKKGVTYSSIRNNWWGSHYVTARRIIE